MSQSLSGELVLLRIGDGASAEQFLPVAQLTVAQHTVNNSEVPFTNRDSAGKAELNGDASIQTEQITGTFVVANNTGFTRLKEVRDARPHQANFEFVEGTGKKRSGNMQIVSMQIDGPQEGVITGNITLSSNGGLVEADA